jgi:hypothetical protein
MKDIYNKIVQIILQKVDIGKIVVQSQPGQKVVTPIKS